MKYSGNKDRWVKFKYEWLSVSAIICDRWGHDSKHCDLEDVLDSKSSLWTYCPWLRGLNNPPVKMNILQRVMYILMRKRIWKVMEILMAKRNKEVLQEEMTKSNEGSTSRTEGWENSWKWDGKTRISGAKMWFSGYKSGMLLIRAKYIFYFDRSWSFLSCLEWVVGGSFKFRHMEGDSLRVTAKANKEDGGLWCIDCIMDDLRCFFFFFFSFFFYFFPFSFFVSSSFCKCFRDRKLYLTKLFKEEDCLG